MWGLQVLATPFEWDLGESVSMVLKTRWHTDRACPFACSTLGSNRQSFGRPPLEACNSMYAFYERPCTECNRHVSLSCTVKQVANPKRVRRLAISMVAELRRCSCNLYLHLIKLLPEYTEVLGKSNPHQPFYLWRLGSRPGDWITS